MKKSQQKFYLPFALLGATLFSSTAHATLVGSLEELNPTPTTYTLIRANLSPQPPVYP